MSWIKIEHGLCKSRKIAKLSAAMGWSRHQSIGFMVDFWIWAAQSCDDGQLAGITDGEIAFAGGLDGAEGILEALIASGFVDREPLRIHEWAEHQAEFLRSKYRRNPGQHEKIQNLYRASTAPVPGQDRDCRGISKQASKQDNKQPMPKPAASIDGFDSFWKAYPRKVGKDKALDAWKKKKPPLEAVLTALSWQIQSDDWRKEGGAYIPHPTTYLNQGRWQDEPKGKYTPQAPKAPLKPMTAWEKAIYSGEWEKMTPEQREAIIEAEA